MAPPRRKARPVREPRNWSSAGRCGACGKVAHESRSAAKKAMRAWHPADRRDLNAYQCHGAEYWHVGHKLRSAMKGA